MFACQSAEELGQRLRRRYQRQQRRRGHTGTSPEADRGLAERLDNLLAD
jgi:hypothetical protein